MVARSMTNDDDDVVVTKGDLRTELQSLRFDLHVEFAQHSKAIMEHMTDLMRAQGDQIQSIADRLDAHVADTSVHLTPGHRRTRRR
jgi:hypothetical protein